MSAKVEKLRFTDFPPMAAGIYCPSRGYFWSIKMPRSIYGYTKIVKLLKESMRRLCKTTLFCFLLLVCSASAAEACPDIDGLIDLNCDQQLEILTFGDSITYGVQDSTGLGYPGRLEEHFPTAIIRNFGKPGEKTPSGRSRAASRFSSFPTADFIIVLEGVNDYWLDSRSSSSTRSNLLSMISSGENTGAVTLLAKLTPVRRSYQKWWVDAVNGAINNYASLDFFVLGEGIIGSDQLHPDTEGYTQMGNTAALALQTASTMERPIDADNDGIYDFAEAQFGALAGNPDTDGDGISDGDEVFTYGSSPASLDSDDDGYSDAYEVSIGANPAGAEPAAPTLTELEAITSE